MLSGLHFRRVTSDQQARGVGQGDRVRVAVRGLLCAVDKEAEWRWCSWEKGQKA